MKNKQTYQSNHSKKPVKIKPVFLTTILPDIYQLGLKCGYNIIPYGSFNKDFDLLCIPWVNNPSEHSTLLDKISDYLGINKENYNFEIKPGGRYSYSLIINYGFNGLGQLTEDIWYLDISFTPLFTDCHIK